MDELLTFTYTISGDDFTRAGEASEAAGFPGFLFCRSNPAAVPQTGPNLPVLGHFWPFYPLFTA